MKKTFKIVGIVLASLAGLLLIAVLLARFAFRDQRAGILNDELKEQRVELLCKAAPYAADTVQFGFAYKQDTVRAREIRDYFRLDTLLRGDATTWENTLALAKFVARNIATRFVTCLPADSLDNDCHVVNIVWLPERQKWAMVDSDMQAFITDPAGTPLSLEEMRRCYIAGEPMQIHPLLDEENDDYYAAYWAKNLYWFACWEQTGYDKEPKSEGRMIVLLPPGFDGFQLDGSAVRTSDPTRFWTAPECALDI